VKYWPLIRSALLRKPAEATLTLLAVTCGFALFGFMVALNATYQRAIETARADRIYVNSRFDAPEGLPIALEKKIEGLDGVTGVGAFRWVSGYHRDPKDSAGVFTVDEGMRVGWSELPLSPAQWDELFSSATGVFATKKAAERWGLHPGDSFHISTPPDMREDGAPGWAFHVLGVVPDDPEWGDGVLIGNYRYAENARPAHNRGYALGFRVAVGDPARAASIARQIDRMFANSGTPTHSITSRANAQSRARSGIAMASMTWGVGIAGLFMIVFLTGNSIAQSVRRRLPEFATLKAIGFTDARVAKLVLAESAIPCCLGAVLGIGLAATLAAVPRRYVPQDLSSVPHATVSVTTFEWALAFALLIALIGSVSPIFTLRRLSVAVALGGRAP
jgi:putative ABC transport system permease protein